MGRVLGGVERDSEVWVRQIAWLNSSVDPDIKPRKSPESRIDTIEEDSYLLNIDPEPYGRYMLSILKQVGMYQNGPNGPEQLSWTEIKAWSDLTETNITPWEAALLMKLSRAFVNQLNTSKSSSCIAPVYEAEQEKLESKRQAISNAFKSMATLQRKRK